jgi:DNA-binding XRE family transcriptional regulator
MMGARGAVFATPPPVIARPSEEPAARSTSDIVRELHAKSGLTWEQLGRLIGVSRRAVHLWAAGGRINARHLELVMQLHDIFDAFLRQRASEEGVVSGTPFYPGRSRGGRHNEDGSD